MTDLEKSIQDLLNYGTNTASPKKAESKAPAPPEMGIGAEAAGLPQMAEGLVDVDEGGKPSLDGIYLPNGELNSDFLVSNANLLERSGEYPLARQIYRTLLRAGFQSDEVLYRMGQCFEQEGKLEEAERTYEESIAYRPIVRTYQALAVLLIRNKKDRYAAEIIERSLYLKELSGDVRFEFHKAAGNCWSRVGDIEKAQDHYLEALSIKEDSSDIRANLGALYIKMKRFAEAEEFLKSSIEAEPSNARARLSLGIAFFERGSKSDALEQFVRVLQLDIKNPTAVYYLLKCAFELKDYERAERLVREYISVGPVNPNLIYSLAGLQYHLGQLGEAGKSTQKVLELKPAHAGATELSRILKEKTVEA